jgi:hypothetical protein
LGETRFFPFKGAAAVFVLWAFELCAKIGRLFPFEAVPTEST